MTISVRENRGGEFYYQHSVGEGDPGPELGNSHSKQAPERGDGTAFSRTLADEPGDLNIALLPIEGDQKGLEQDLRSGALGRWIGNLVDAGCIVVHDTPADAGVDVRSATGLTEADGTIRIFATTIAPGKARATVLHEIFHAGVKPMLYGTGWDSLLGYLKPIYVRATAGDRKLSRMWHEAFARVEGADAGGVRDAGDRRIEEFAAYAVESYEAAPLALRPWIGRVTGFGKAWAFRRFGVQLGRLTPAQLRSLTAAALRSIAGGKIPPMPAKSRRMLSAEDTFAAQFMIEMAANDALFQYPTSKARSVKGAVEDIGRGLRFQGDARSEEERQAGIDRKWLIRNQNGQDAFVFEKGDEVWIDISDFTEGRAGNAVYSAVADYAFNTEKVFVGDPAGLSDIAMRRRLDNMISTALKHGTTDHIAPHERQVAGDAAIGVPPLQWRPGDTIGNIQHMMGVAVASLTQHVPEIARARYDVENRTFRTGEGKPISDGMLDFWSAHPRIRAACAGRATLKRGVLFNTLLRREGSGRPGLLEQILHVPDQFVGPLLRRTFYSVAPETKCDVLTAAHGQLERAGRPDFAETIPVDMSQFVTHRGLICTVLAGQLHVCQPVRRAFGHHRRSCEARPRLPRG